MEDILELQRQLAAAQSSTATSRLSERNCIELVMKLQSLSLVDLIFTRSGKEYLTPSQLRREMQDEIFVRGGRVNVIDLPDALNVDLSHVHAALPDVLRDSPSPTRVVNGEIVTDEYLATLAAEIEVGLAQSSDTGTDTIGDIATRTNLPVELVRECVKTHIGTKTIHATLDEPTGTIRSHASRARAAAAASGALRAIGTPTLITEVASVCGLPFDIVLETCHSLLTTHDLRGRVDGRGQASLFTPTMFDKAAHSAAISSFNNAGFITMDRLKSMHILNPDKFAMNHAPGSTRVDNLIIAPAFLDTIQSTALEVVLANAWLDFSGMFPPDFPSVSVPRVVNLFDHCSGSSSRVVPATISSNGRGSKATKRKAPKGAAVDQESSNPDQSDENTWKAVKIEAPILGGQFLVCPSILLRCSECVKNDAANNAKARAKTILDMMTVVGSKSVSVERAPPGTSIDDAVDGKKSSKSKSRRRKDKSLTAASGEDREYAQGKDQPVIIPTVAEVCSLILEDEHLHHVFEADYLGNAPANTEEVIECIVEEFLNGQDGLTRTYETEAATAVAEMERAKEAEGVALVKKILWSLERAELFDQSAQALDCVSADLPLTCRIHVLETICLTAFLHCLDLVANNLGIPGSGIQESIGETPSLDIVKILVTRLPSDMSSKTRDLYACLQSKNSGNDCIIRFLEAYDNCAASLDLPERRPLDKKRERGVAAGVRDQIVTAMSEDGISKHPPTTTDVLHAVTTLLFAKCKNGAMVHLAPGRVLEVCEWLEQNMSAESCRASLASLRSDVLECLQQPNLSPKELPQLEPRFLQKLAELRQYFAPQQ